jgi:hypothetical protein
MTDRGYMNDRLTDGNDGNDRNSISDERGLKYECKQGEML